MRVAFTSDVYWPRINGVSVSTNIFMNELTRMGHTLKLWTSKYPITHDEKKLHHHDPRVSRMNSWWLFFDPEDHIPSVFQQRSFFKQLDAFKPDILHVQTEFTLSWMAKAYAKKRKVPLIMTCHTYFEQYAAHYFNFLPENLAKYLCRAFTFSSFNSADAIISPTEPMKQVLVNYGISCPIYVVPTGIQEEDFRGTDKAYEKENSRWILQYPQLKGKKIMLYVGRIGQEKNMDFLLEAVEKIRETNPDTVLLAAGNGPYLSAFRKKVRARGLSENIICLGYVDRKEIKHLYTFADVFTFPSKTETQGLVTIEAMMCKTPVVAVGLMGTKEVMNGDNGGFMVKDDVNEFAARVVELFNNPELYRRKSEEAYAYAQNWTSEKMAVKISKLYDQVIADYQAKPAKQK